MISEKREDQSRTVILVDQPAFSLVWVLAGAAFLFPAVFSSPQWLTGTVVNFLLFVAAAKLDSKNRWPIVILPSLGALAHGVIFGPLTVFLAFFLPFIWLGNAVLVGFAGSKFFSQRPFLLRVLAASLLKFLVLFLAARLYFALHLVPAVFLVSMGLLQLATALAGGVAAYLFLRRS